jgi:hydroxymethylpyrimidine pyrophosphatase-like HAD family hydrolase
VRIQTLAVDYDGTIAHRGTLSAETQAALTVVRKSGRRVILVTGRVLEDLIAIGVDLKLFDAVVAENGALFYDPSMQESILLGEAPPPAFLEELARRDVPASAGRGIVATVEPHESEILAVIRDIGIEWQVIFNKGSVMALPSSVTKGSGLLAALDRLKLSAHNTAGVGDAENDHNFLSICEVSVAVANALPAIKERADLVMRRKNGRGVAEFIEGYLLDDLARAQRVLARHTVEVGTQKSGAPVRVPVHCANYLIVGSSGSGKSTLTGVLVERLVDQGYQVCMIDPEGDHTGLDPLVTLGSTEAKPTFEEIDSALERAPAGLVVNLVAVSRADKVRFASELLAAVIAARAVRGRPHWVVIDEAHHLLPAYGAPGSSVWPRGTDGVCLISLSPEVLAREALASVTHLFVTGEDAPEQVKRFATARGLALPERAEPLSESLLHGEALLIPVRAGRSGRPERFQVARRRTEHRRHVRKYSGGDLGPEYSFYFRGPQKRLNLRAFNVTVFCEMARGVDAETWRYHLARGEISHWFRRHIKDPDLADAIRPIESRAEARPPEETRRQVLDLVESRYAGAA